MKYLYTAVFILAFGSASFSQCANGSNFDIVVNTNYTGSCNEILDLNDVRVDEIVYFKLSASVSTTPNEIKWESNLEPAPFYDGSILGTVSNINFPTSFTVAGVHTITCTYEFDGNCIVVETFDLTVSDRDCPFLKGGVVLGGICDYPDALVEFNITDDPNFTYTIDNVTWSISDQNNNVSVYNSSGNYFSFIPSIGEYYGTGLATVTLSNNTVCTTPINGPNCPINFGEFQYSDPFFELVGSNIYGESLDLVFKGTNIYPLPTTLHQYSVYDGPTMIISPMDMAYNQPIPLTGLSVGLHTIKLVGERDTRECPDEYEVEIEILHQDTIPDECISCNTFKPLIGERYWLSAWVKEDQAAQVKNFDNVSIELDFIGGSLVQQFQTTGDIVEGWQRIVGSFTIPTGTTDLDIKLKNTNTSIQAYFDDVRIHPFNASMKSYVYDPETLWLTSELDDNNYATFYEYDKQGQLIRIKKETARGIMTIQESRSSNPKKD